MSTLETATKSYYDAYYAIRGLERNDLRLNPGVLFQTLAQEASVIQALRSIDVEPRTAQLLDVGCGDGANLFQLLRLGFRPTNITGIDLLRDRIERARTVYPNIRWVHGDAATMDFDDGCFDLVFESTMFVAITDDKLAERIASEMVRVCKVGGYLVLVDWWTQKPGDPKFRALTIRRLRTMFRLGQLTSLQKSFRGALIPPLGRMLSQWLPSMYFVVSSLFPFTAAQGVYVLRRLPD